MSGDRRTAWLAALLVVSCGLTAQAQTHAPAHGPAATPRRGRAPHATASAAPASSAPPAASSAPPPPPASPAPSAAPTGDEDEDVGHVGSAPPAATGTPSAAETEGTEENPA